MKSKVLLITFALAATLALAVTALGCQKKEFIIGEKGPAGGIVFYDKGKVDNGWRYLEAAPSDQSGGIRWFNGGKYSNVETSTNIGSGKANTESIIAAQGNGDYAAALCKKLKIKGYSDWFLPSKDELDLMYANLGKAGLGGFGKWWIWSSSQVAKKGDEMAIDYSAAWLERFSDGKQDSTFKDALWVVRACREF